MISDGSKKIAVRSLSEAYVDEFPFNYLAHLVLRRARRLNKKSICIMIRERKVNLYPEE